MMLKSLIFYIYINCLDFGLPAYKIDFTVYKLCLVFLWSNDCPPKMVPPRLRTAGWNNHLLTKIRAEAKPMRETDIQT